MPNPKQRTDIEKLLPSERQQRIRQMILEQSILRVSDLAGTFEVSEMTIRRDLEVLEDAGHVERTFGGAVVAEQAAFESNYSVRLETQIKQKQAIARYAASLIKEGDSVALDASTTALILAKELTERRITVITNSLDSAQALRNSQAKVILTGGHLRQVAGSFTGPLAIETLKRLHVDHAFISAKGVRMPDGLMDSDLDEASVKRAIINSAAHVTAIVDSSKFGKHALASIAGFTELDLCITDSQLPSEMQDGLEAHGVSVSKVDIK